MAHFAEVKNTDNKVLRVVVISNDDVNANGGDYSSDAEAVSYTHLTLPTNREV